jgi:hypothetical protein
MNTFFDASAQEGRHDNQKNGIHPKGIRQKYL